MRIMSSHLVKILLLSALTAIFSSTIYCGIQGTDKEMIVSANGGLRMRAAPNLDSQRLLTIPNHSVVKVLEFQDEEIEIAGTKGRWVRVFYEEKEGWVFSGFLEQISSNADLSKLIDKQATYCDECQDGSFLYFALHSDGTFDMSCREVMLSPNNAKSHLFEGTWTAVSTGVILKGSFTSSPLSQPKSVVEKRDFIPISLEFAFDGSDRFSALKFISNEPFSACLMSWNLNESNTALAGWRIR